MHRLVWSQLRRRGGRTIALLLGILVATTSFTVLTGTSQTSQLKVVGTVKENFRSAYDVLVRPKGSKTALERQEGVVRQNFLSGIYGGITLAQYQKVKQIPGVQVAAPIAMIGYVLQTVQVPVPIPHLSQSAERQLYRLKLQWIDSRGLTHIQDADQYVYVTKHQIDPVNRFFASSSVPQGKEVLKDGSAVPICPYDFGGPVDAGPFTFDTRTSVLCWSRETGLYGQNGSSGHPDSRPSDVGARVTWSFPLLLAAVDPVQEQRLTGLGHNLIAGRYLQQGEKPVQVPTDGQRPLSAPVIAASESFMDQQASVQIQDLGTNAAAAIPTLSTTSALMHFLASQPSGPRAGTTSVDAPAAYLDLLKQLRVGLIVQGYQTASPTRYRRLGPRKLAPIPTHNDARQTWMDPYQPDGYFRGPLPASDTAFRRLHEYFVDATTQHPLAGLKLVGTFDPNRLTGQRKLSAVPLATYRPPAAAPADARTSQLLNGHDLLPNSNVAGYLQQPPLLLTNLASLPLFTGGEYFRPSDGTTSRSAAAPISVIRVRVAGVTGPDSVSRERVREVGQQISERTGLDVDITVGSSPTNTTIDLPAGTFGRPALTLSESWVKKGVAVAILTALNRKSIALFALILIVCGLFVANAASAAVRSRRTELGVLACLGWSTRRLFAAMLWEVGLVGLVAGVVGSAIALPISAAVGLHVSAWRAGIAVPAAVLLTLLAGLVPAIRAARSDPGAAVRPIVTAVRRARQPRTVVGLAVTNLLRAPGRSLLGAASLAVGVLALTFLLGVTLAFRGVLVGSLLGNAISVQTRGVDYIAVAVIVVLGGLSVADVLYLNIRERAGEFATLRATGWREGTLSLLIGAEGVGMGVAGALVGAGLGIAGVAAFAGGLSASLIGTAIAAAAVGVAIAALAALIPAALLRRLPTAQLLAEE